MVRIINRTILIVLAIIVLVPNARGQSLILGVLEDVPGVYVGETNVRKVRVVFQKKGTEWSAFRSDCPDQTCLKTITPDFPRVVIWNIGFDGRALGQVTGRTPNDFKFYAHVGLQDIPSGAPVPTIGKKSAEFSRSAGGLVYRPLIANSQPYLMDPEAWKPSQSAPEQIRLFRQQFRKKFPKFCRISKDETKLEPFLYRDEDVEVVKTYPSKKGWRIVRLHLADAVDCKDVEAGSEIDDSWFALDPNDRSQYLGSGMWLVDAGDYDNDGGSELVFSIERENSGGYELFYDDFRKHVTFQFSYH
jgi:hypothetical protein